MTAREAYDQLRTHHREAVLFGSMGALMGWDQRVMMPKNGSKFRAEQMAALAGFLHDKETDPRIGDWLAQCEGSELTTDPTSVEAVNIRWWRREFDQATKIPKSLAVEMARVTSLAEDEWAESRAQSDFKRFEPWLSQIVDLTKQAAECLGYEDEPYDALLDRFEPGMTAKEIERLFQPLREYTPKLVQRIQDAPKKPNTSILNRHFPVQDQVQFSREAAAALGFDFDSGRLDPTVHPFACRVTPGDTRITTRYYDDQFNPSFFGTIHETGHALYEMGLLEDHFGEPMGESVSLGIHESQSRMWENVVARSRPFWEKFFPIAQQRFSALSDVSLDDFVFAVNAVKPSAIRVEADEVTYNLHIMLRFELEVALIRGDIAARDMAEAWKDKFETYMGFRPPNDKEGALQDVHWSGGMIGYFPTYSLGNLYGAMFYNQALEDLGDLDSMYRRGEFSPLLDWLRKKIHNQGCRYDAKKLVEHVTGKPLSPQPLIDYMEAKFSALYGL